MEFLNFRVAVKRCFCLEDVYVKTIQQFQKYYLFDKVDLFVVDLFARANYLLNLFISV